MHPAHCSCRVSVYSTHGQGCTCTTDLARLLSFCTQLASEFKAMNALRPLSFDPVDKQWRVSANGDCVNGGGAAATACISLTGDLVTCIFDW